MYYRNCINACLKCEFYQFENLHVNLRTQGGGNFYPPLNSVHVIEFAVRKCQTSRNLK